MIKFLLLLHRLVIFINFFFYGFLLLLFSYLVYDLHHAEAVLLYAALVNGFAPISVSFLVRMLLFSLA